MSAFVMIQNRELPPEQGGGHVVYAWPADVEEAFCCSEDQAFTDDAHRVIVAGTDRCSLHAGYELPCLVAWRTPPQCPHERLDPAADPSRPRCSTCGLIGIDESARYLRNPIFRAPPPYDNDVIALGAPEAS